jgi:hypothetical protein
MRCGWRCNSRLRRRGEGKGGGGKGAQRMGRAGTPALAKGAMRQQEQLDLRMAGAASVWASPLTRRAEGQLRQKLHRHHQRRPPHCSSRP